MDKGDSKPANVSMYMGTPIYEPADIDDIDAKPVTDVSDSSNAVPHTDEGRASQVKSERDSQDQVDTAMEGLDINDDSPDRLLYRMDNPHRGHFIIINNKKFLASTRMNERTGTDADAANLHSRFRALGFAVKIYHNLSAQEMLKIMIGVSEMDHSKNDCLAIAILSHGDEGIVYGVDQVVKIDTLVAPFKGDRCKSLIGKPKIFIIQACRGTALDHGAQHDAMAEGEAQTYRVPTEADILYAYSTVSGYFSWRNSTKGSWFIQALCRKLEKYGTQWDLTKILTYVNHEVAYEFESNASQAHMNKKKQVPSLVSMLTKELVFTPKK